MSDKKFVDGLIVRPPHDRAPDFVKCSISIKRKDLGNWLRAETEDWINIDVKQSKTGNWYAEVNQWKPSDHEKNKSNGYQPEAGDDFSDDIPFARHHGLV